MKRDIGGGAARAVRVLAVIGALAITGCAAEVGSDRWCEEMAEKPTGDWTANEATAYTKHCVLGLKPDG